MLLRLNNNNWQQQVSNIAFKACDNVVLLIQTDTACALIKFMRRVSFSILHLTDVDKSME